MDLFAPMYFSPDVITTNPTSTFEPAQPNFIPPSPSPQPMTPSGQPFMSPAFAPSSGGTQYAGISNLGVQTAYLGQYADGTDYAKAAAVLSGAARTGLSMSRGDFAGAVMTGVGTAAGAYLSGDSFGRIGMDLVGSPPTFVDGTGAPIMSFGSPGQ